mmetsp:Transcript_1003/g.3139  ORF Transcript_1003/g.3139 Transcript_1003/m.3139 type:complete len:313 (-) Transcript_1003:732-1670(-)
MSVSRGVPVDLGKLRHRGSLCSRGSRTSQRCGSGTLPRCDLLHFRGLAGPKGRLQRRRGSISPRRCGISGRYGISQQRHLGRSVHSGLSLLLRGLSHRHCRRLPHRGLSHLRDQFCCCVLQLRHDLSPRSGLSLQRGDRGLGFLHCFTRQRDSRIQGLRIGRHQGRFERLSGIAPRRGRSFPDGSQKLREMLRAWSCRGCRGPCRLSGPIFRLHRRNTGLNGLSMCRRQPRHHRLRPCRRRPCRRRPSISRSRIGTRRPRRLFSRGGNHKPHRLFGLFDSRRWLIRRRSLRGTSSLGPGVLSLPASSLARRR